MAHAYLPDGSQADRPVGFVPNIVSGEVNRSQLTVLSSNPSESEAFASSGILHC